MMLLIVLTGLLVPWMATSQVRTGADVLVAQRMEMLAGKRVGIITNATGRLSGGTFLVDSLVRAGVHVTALFGPEHGIRAAAAAGDHVGDDRDPATGIPVYSLYGTRTKPTPEQLGNVDVLLYDIQDVGARFYTYISTMVHCMEAAAAANVPFIVLDRPNPIGDLIDGPLLEDSLRSFVGIAPVPVAYGLTPGEFARMANASGWLEGGLQADLTVIPLEGWKRGMTWTATGLAWVPPSPNIPDAETALVYPGMCLVEGISVSEGRGTGRPFRMIGAPFIKGAQLADTLNAIGMEGVRFAPASFTPSSSKFSGQQCQGVELQVTDRSEFRPVAVGVEVLRTLVRLYPDGAVLREAGLKRLSGISGIVAIVKSGKPVYRELRQGWMDAGRAFGISTARFQLYPR